MGPSDRIGIGSDRSGIGSGWDRDRIGSGSDRDRDRDRIGSGSDRDMNATLILGQLEMWALMDSRLLQAVVLCVPTKFFWGLDGASITNHPLSRTLRTLRAKA